jgi:hypothetical protein
MGASPSCDLVLRSQPGLRLHNREEVSNVQITVELCLLLSCQHSSLRPICKLKLSSSRSSKAIESRNSAASEDSSSFCARINWAQNSRFAVWAKELGTHRELVLIVEPTHASRNKYDGGGRGIRRNLLQKPGGKMPKKANGSTNRPLALLNNITLLCRLIRW